MVNTRVSSEVEPKYDGVENCNAVPARWARPRWSASRGSRVSPKAVTPIGGNGLRKRSGPDTVTDLGAGP